MGIIKLMDRQKMWLNNFNSEDSEMQEREVNHYPSSWNASHNDHKPKPKNNKVVI